MRVEFIVGFGLLRRLFSRYSSFPCATKSNTPTKNLSRIEDLHENQLKLLWLLLERLKFIFIYFITNHKNYDFLDCDWFEKLLFSTNSPVNWTPLSPFTISKSVTRIKVVWIQPLSSLDA